jgi:ATP-dependent DNA ligase
MKLRDRREILQAMIPADGRILFSEATRDRRCLIGVQREAGKPAMVLMADKGRYMGSAFVTFKADKRQALWDRVQGKVGAPPPKGLKKEKAEWLRPGVLGRVRFLKGEEQLRHAMLKDFWED